MLLPLRYCLPRRRCTATILLILGVLLLLAVAVVIHTGMIVAVNVGMSPRRSSQEFEVMIPSDTQGMLSLKPRPKQQTPRPGVTTGELEKLPYTKEPGVNRTVERVEMYNTTREVETGVEECKDVSTKVLFFIRIPKCASTSFVELLRKLAQKSKFELFFHPSGAYDWDKATKQKIADMCRSRMKSPNGFLYARHFYYVDFREYGLQDYTYVTIIRDPVPRFVSSYLYYHFSSKHHIQAILNPLHRNESLLTCLEHEHDGCTRNLITKYFCGHEKFCKTGDSTALSRAKENLREGFAAVGIMEEMELSMKVFSRLLPRYLERIGDLDLMLVNKNEHSLEITPEIHEAIVAANMADVELYRYAVDLLHFKGRACNLL